jgi:hypothetical protein
MTVFGWCSDVRSSRSHTTSDSGALRKAWRRLQSDDAGRRQPKSLRDAAAYCLDRGLDAVVEVQLVEDAGDVVGDGVRAE